MADFFCGAAGRSTSKILPGKTKKTTNARNSGDKDKHAEEFGNHLLS
jgi:hypothetical protein